MLRLPSMWKPAAKLVLDPAERQLLETWARAHNAPQNVAMRCQVVLLAADGLANNAIRESRGDQPAHCLAVARTVRRRGAAGPGPGCAPPGAPPSDHGRHRQAHREGDNRKPRRPPPRIGAGRTLARAQGVSPATGAADLGCPRAATRIAPGPSKLSTDIRFVEKLTDVVGLYLHPPDKAIVL